MARLFFAFLAALALLSLTTATRSRGLAADPAVERLRSRQVTRVKLAEMRERRAEIARGVLRPCQSAKAYPRCTTVNTAGFARFPG